MPGRETAGGGLVVASAGVATRRAATPLLHLSGVSRVYGERTALHPVDLALRAGRCVALLGANGSGKSTLLRIACGRDAPTAGTVSLAGTPLVEEDVRARTEIAVVSDIVGYYPDLTLREHLTLVAVAHGAGSDPETGAAALVEAALTDCRLDDHADLLPGALSSGQTQALLLAAALVRPRRLLVLDEPEQRLDPAARDWLAGVLAAEKRAGTALLVATHHTDLAAAVADRVVVLRDGEVVADGAPAKVLSGAIN
jgi:ABC-2 type transport system ATP-binding protein